MNVRTLLVDKLDHKKRFLLEASGNQAWSYGSVVLVVSEKYVRFTGLVVAKEYRNVGTATELLREALKFANSFNLPIFVEVDSFSTETLPLGMNDVQLRSWYTKHGFVPVEGHPFAMVYHPL